MSDNSLLFKISLNDDDDVPVKAIRGGRKGYFLSPLLPFPLFLLLLFVKWLLKTLSADAVFKRNSFNSRDDFSFQSTVCNH